MRIALNVVAALFLFFGTVWFLQGINVLPGSFMTGDPKWAYIGGALVVIAVAILAKANRKRA